MPITWISVGTSQSGVSACPSSSRRPPRVSDRPQEARARAPCSAQRVVLVSLSITTRTRAGVRSRLPLAIPLAVAQATNFSEFRLRVCELFHTWWGISCGSFSRERAATPRSDDRFGSNSEVAAPPRYFCFAPMNGHRETQRPSPVRAKSGSAGRRGCVARPKVGSRCSSVGSVRAAPSRFVADLPVDAISNASNSESRPCANAKASRAERP